MGVAARHVLEELEGRERQFLARALEPARALGADGEEDGVELPAHVLERDVDAEAPAHPELAAEHPDDVDLLIQHLVRQPERRDAVAQHAARLVVGVEEDRRVPATQQVVGGAQACRTRADNRDTLAARRLSVRGT